MNGTTNATTNANTNATTRPDELCGGVNLTVPFGVSFYLHYDLIVIL